ncbi:hypothetical protein TH19_03330 [Thalassospira profundimaris]|uniref:Uncharacterized protein n=1 Tax=Thalassospira profundimaris TaxID=502049 RepID=A0A367WBV0_9PROT|nr:hypothetical protein TH19_03330 [Thalassospira profundimaris]
MIVDFTGGLICRFGAFGMLGTAMQPAQGGCPLGGGAITGEYAGLRRFAVDSIVDSGGQKG